MIDVSELIKDSDFAENYMIHRKKGVWENGRFHLTEEQTIPYIGVIQPASEKELEQLDIGDRQKFVMKFLCTYPDEIFVTQQYEQEEYFSDTIEYLGHFYKVIKVKNWLHSGGYCRAFAVEVDENGAY